MRSRAALIGLLVALSVALAGIGVAIWALAAERRADPSASSEPVSATDFCYVEAMIYYRVEATDLSNALLETPGISAEGQATAEDMAAAQTAELDELRPWYVSWREYRPLERPSTGPCAAHADHAQMPGMPSTAEWNALLDAEGQEAERVYAELLIAQNEAMVAFATEILAGDPHPRVAESAERVIAQGEDDIALLEALL